MNKKEPPIVWVGGSFYGAGNGIQTRGLNFGKVACYRYTIPALHFLTNRIIAHVYSIVKLSDTHSKREGIVFKNLTSPSFCLSLSEPSALCNTILALDVVPYRHKPPA